MKVTNLKIKSSLTFLALFCSLSFVENAFAGGNKSNSTHGNSESAAASVISDGSEVCGHSERLPLNPSIGEMMGMSSKVIDEPSQLESELASLQLRRDYILMLNKHSKSSKITSELRDVENKMIALNKAMSKKPKPLKSSPNDEIVNRISFLQNELHQESLRRDYLLGLKNRNISVDHDITSVEDRIENLKKELEIAEDESFRLNKPQDKPVMIAIQDSDSQRLSNAKDIAMSLDRRHSVKPFFRTGHVGVKLAYEFSNLGEMNPKGIVNARTLYVESEKGTESAFAYTWQNARGDLVYSILEGDQADSSVTEIGKMVKQGSRYLLSLNADRTKELEVSVSRTDSKVILNLGALGKVSYDLKKNRSKSDIQVKTSLAQSFLDRALSVILANETGLAPRLKSLPTEKSIYETESDNDDAASVISGVSATTLAGSENSGTTVSDTHSSEK